MIGAGRGSFELTGLDEDQVIGRPVKEVLGLQFIEEGDGGEEADTTGTASPTRSRRRWSGAFARWASGSRSMPRETFRPRRSPTSFPATTTTAAC